MVNFGKLLILLNLSAFYIYRKMKKKCCFMLNFENLLCAFIFGA